MTRLDLPCARILFTVRADAVLHLPDYAGSMLRGAFGHALRELALLPHPDNKPCAAKDTCPYCRIFLTQGHQKPASYVIEPPRSGSRVLQSGETFDFGLVLIGKTQDQWPLIVLAFERAMKRGLGKGQQPATLLEARQENGPLLWRVGDRAASPISCDLPSPSPTTSRAQLHFITPLRLQQQGEPLRKNALNSRNLLLALARRYQLLADLHHGPEAAQQDFPMLCDAMTNIELDASAMRWQDYKRYSSRQRQETPLGGLVGNLYLRGDLSLFHPLLHLGQWLHLGKETVFGLGHYQLEWL